ncbi:acyltransferase family protein [Rhodococcus hoagii]|nr:acyltransferase family protein [Prescottella equi]
MFFALSGFLLWRPHAAAARGLGRPPTVARYWLNRAARILRPTGCWLCWCWRSCRRPAAAGRCGMSNLALLQVFVPLTLTEGLTQMWSLSVEVAFYLVLPILALALVKLRGDSARFRVPVLLAAAMVSLTWASCPSPPRTASTTTTGCPATSVVRCRHVARRTGDGGRDVGAPPGRAAGMDGGDRGRGLRVVDDVAGRARGTGPRRAVAVRHEDRPRRGHEFRVAGAAGSRRAPAPDPGEPGGAGRRTVVVRPVHLASRGADDRVPDVRHRPVQRQLLDRPRRHQRAQHRGGVGQLRARRGTGPPRRQTLGEAPPHRRTPQR